MSEKKNVFMDNMAVITTPEGIQKYLFGTKKNGQPRALYDVLKEIVPGMSKGKGKKKDKKKKNKHKKNSNSSKYNFYISAKNGKKHKKKHWHI